MQGHWKRVRRFVQKSYSRILQRLVFSCYYIVYPSQALLRMTASDISKNVHSIVIEDPWQLNNWHDPRSLPVDPGHLIKLIWFGSNLNIDYLISYLPSIVSVKSKNQRLSLLFCQPSLLLMNVKNFFTTIKIFSWGGA